ncbi:putative transposase family protein [Mycobacterium xenopi 4042]|uniref:Putative transposase family protein n=1 Tax=Mycobacterium xenopi 4042 TaxID=1299334 RepID=X8DXQ4_MYCXE|nr:putative transposase family protein [Mycobacterium xenopi 4042]
MRDSTRLQRAKRRSKNRERKRETVAARHRKIANQRKDFHHKQARTLVARYDLLAVEGLTITNMLRRAKPVPDPDNPASIWPTERPPKVGCREASVTPAGAGSSQYCAPKRKRLGVSGLRSTPAYVGWLRKMRVCSRREPRHASGLRLPAMLASRPRRRDGRAQHPPAGLALHAQAA